MDIVKQLAGTPLWQSAYEIAHTGLDTVELVPRPDLAFPDRAGASHFGGMPELPPGTRWPRGGGRPLALLLQLGLADLRGIAGTHLLPSDGTLWFFYDVIGQPWGLRQRERSGWRVLHAPADAVLRPARHPAGLPDEHVLPLVTCTPQPTVTFPGPHSDRAVIDGDDDLLYRELVLGGDRIRHLLLGHPDPIQRDPVGRGSVSLLQLDTDPLLGTSWGDSGKLHWTIGAVALAERRFDTTWLELQCC